jgi:hypothetical protein
VPLLFLVTVCAESTPFSKALVLFFVFFGIGEGSLNPNPPPPQDWQVFPKENPDLKKIEAREHPKNTKEKMDPCFTHVKFGPSPTMRFYFILDSLTK